VEMEDIYLINIIIIQEHLLIIQKKFWSLTIEIIIFDIFLVLFNAIVGISVKERNNIHEGKYDEDKKTFKNALSYYSYRIHTIFNI